MSFQVVRDAISKVRKALVPAIPAVGALVAATFGELSTEAAIWTNVVSLLVAVGIYATPNKQEPQLVPAHVVGDSVVATPPERQV